MLEEIVKLYVPFTGIYKSAGFDEKSRIHVPTKIVNTLKARQKIKDNDDVKLYYRLETEKSPQYLEITDYFPLGDNTIPFYEYKNVKLDKQDRILIPKRDLETIGMNDIKNLEFVCLGNVFLICSEGDNPTNKEV